MFADAGRLWAFCGKPGLKAVASGSSGDETGASWFRELAASRTGVLARSSDAKENRSNACGQ